MDKANTPADKKLLSADDLAGLEKRAAKKVDMRSTWIGLIAVFVLFLITLVLPFTGKANGFDILVMNDTALEFGATPLERIFVILGLVSMVVVNLAVVASRSMLLTYINWVLAGTTGTAAMFMIWMGQTRLRAEGSSGTEFGAALSGLVAIAFLLMMTGLIFRRSEEQLDIEDARREAGSDDPVADAQREASIGRRFSRYEDSPLFVDDRRQKASERHRVHDSDGENA
ncbi:hypothetical protein CCICO_06945 [Corynebacterium ciconiae DSM 44920]|uniref:Rv2732c family membrane protein n=1 Tax=Corynebacterium ciconiae TaxID=227319 RepID=UPI000371523B|nr:hypothetical protein [Corynebacterium ciconiae]WKD61409.1 hypothetical protein CCICO_06945 [Corynebacterium ciconiae DSM 44920]